MISFRSLFTGVKWRGPDWSGMDRKGVERIGKTRNGKGASEMKPLSFNYC